VAHLPAVCLPCGIPLCGPPMEDSTGAALRLERASRAGGENYPIKANHLKEWDAKPRVQVSF
jgi:hypothetical protein